jgi:hypothetical protein
VRAAVVAAEVLVGGPATGVVVVDVGSVEAGVVAVGVVPGVVEVGTVEPGVVAVVVGVVAVPVAVVVVVVAVVVVVGVEVVPVEVAVGAVAEEVPTVNPPRRPCTVVAPAVCCSVRPDRSRVTAGVDVLAGALVGGVEALAVTCGV